MSTPLTVDDLFLLYDKYGDEEYGEAITQTSHALQCAALARDAGAPDALVVASLFHDVGHLLALDERGAQYDEAGPDDQHEAVGARVLSQLFGPDVARPVALHVTAKRWRCAVDPDYYARLSPASTASLAAQGGPLDGPSRARFEAQPGFHEAVALRTWDDEGKVVGLATGELEDYRDVASSLAERWRRGRRAR